MLAESLFYDLSSWINPGEHHFVPMMMMKI